MHEFAKDVVAVVLSIVLCGRPHSASPVCSTAQLSNLAVKSYVYA